MKLKISVLLILMTLLTLSVIAEKNLVYSLSLKYEGNKLINEGLKLIEGNAPTRAEQPEIGFTLKIFDFNSQQLYSFKFSMDNVITRDAPREIFDEDGNQISIPNDNPIIIKEVVTTLVIPYFDNAKLIEVYDEENKLLLTVDVSKFSTKKPSVQITGSLYYLLAGLALLALMGMVVAFKIKRKSKNHKQHVTIGKYEDRTKEHKTSHKKTETKTRYCEDCGQQLSDISKYCPRCGRKL